MTPATDTQEARLRALFDALAADATRFDFYYTLRFIEACSASSEPLGRGAHPRSEPVRMSQTPSLIFAPATLHRYTPDVAGEGRGRLDVHHFGLFGPHGPLPSPFTEYVQERLLHHQDPTLLRFCDMFQHRMILLFYRAWADAQPTTSLDHPGRDRFSRYVASLGNLGQPALRQRDEVPDASKLHHVGHLARPTRNPEGLVRALSALIRVPLCIIEHCMQWLSMSEADQTRLLPLRIAGHGEARTVSAGATSQRLGMGAVLGRRVPDVQYRFRLRVGPMSLSDFERFLPGRLRFGQLRDWVRNYVGFELAWDAQLVLRREEVPATRLGSYGQLGWTTWLGTPADRRERDRDDVCLDIERLSRLRAT